MPITVMISLVVTVALFLISLLFRIAARLNLTLPLLYFLAVSTILIHGQQLMRNLHLQSSIC